MVPTCDRKITRATRNGVRKLFKDFVIIYFMDKILLLEEKSSVTGHL
jgi:hypothetical protein